MVDTKTLGIWGPDQLLSYSSSSAYFTSISCTDALDCTTVGEGDAVPIYANESDGTWGAVTDTPDVSGYLNSVSCTRIGDCAAVGDGTTDDPISFALVDTETDGTWGTPTDLYSIWDDPSLASVSCSSAGDCTAVGNNNPPVYATESGGVWALRSNCLPPRGLLTHTLSQKVSLHGCHRLHCRWRCCRRR